MPQKCIWRCKKWVSSSIFELTHFLRLQMHFWGTSRRNFQKRKTLLYCTFSRSTQIWCQNWCFLTLKFYHFKGISQNSLTSMQPIVDDGSLKFWENYPKVVLKRNIIWKNCVHKKGWFLAPLNAHVPMAGSFAVGHSEFADSVPGWHTLFLQGLSK